MGDYSAQFGGDLLAALGYPKTPDNLAFMQAWATAEGGHARFNPFNTTQPVAGSTWYNTFGEHGQYHVQNYPNYGAGLNATVHTLTNGNYQPILNALAAGGDAMLAAQAVAASPWGTGGGVIAVLTAQGYHHAQPAPPPPAPEPPKDDEMILLNVAGTPGIWLLFPATGAYIHVPDPSDVVTLEHVTPYPAGAITGDLHQELLATWASLKAPAAA